MSRPGIIVAARMTSSRLPGKPLMPFRGTTVIGSCLERCAETGIRVALAVPHATASKPLFSVWPEVYGWPDEGNVLARIVATAECAGIDTVVRITGDCPLAEPGLITTMLDWFDSAGDGVQLVSNVYLERTFAKGLDVEIVRASALRALLPVATAEEREHVTLGLYRRLGQDEILPFANDGSYPDQECEPLCVDTAEDLARLNAGWLS